MKSNKLRNLIIISTVIFLSITAIGFSAWVITSNFFFTPIHKIDAEWEKYLGGQSHFESGDGVTGVLPTSTNLNVVNVTSSELNGYKTYFMLQDQDGANFEEGKPVNTGAYFLMYTKDDETHIITFYVISKDDWVCYIDSNTEANRYASIEEALSVAKANASSNTIYTRINKYGSTDIDIIIRNDCEIGSGDTLYLQCGLSVTRSNKQKGSVSGGRVTESDGTVTDGRDYGLSETDPINDANCKVFISSNVILTNNGTIIIDGQISSGYGASPSAGHTCGINSDGSWADYQAIKGTADENVLYSILCLEEDAIINSYGNVYCYGFLYEDSDNNGSQLIMNSGTLYMPFVMKDFGGGSSMRAVQVDMASRKSSPFNEFCFENVSCLLTIKYNASFIAWGNLYAGSRHNQTDINFVANNTKSGNYVIEFSNENSYLTAKYNPKTQIIDLNTYGSFKTNPLILELSILITITISTDIVYFPLSWHFNITLNKSPYETQTYIDAQQIFKLMPGSSLTVEKGVYLYISEIVIYTEFNDQSAMSKTLYKQGLPEGNFVINGIVETNRIAGKVKSKTTGAQLIVNDNTNASNETYITAYEPKTHIADSLDSKVTSWYSLNEVFELKVLTKTGISEDYVSGSVGTYLSRKFNTTDEYAGWYSNEINLYFNANDGEFVDSSLSIFGPIDASQMESGGGYLINYDNIQLPEVYREHYNFMGWYLDRNMETEANGQIVYISTTIYAIWQPINYDVNYNLNNFESFTTPPTDDITSAISRDTLSQWGLPLTYNIETQVPLPTEYMAYSNYVFEGWYINNSNNQLVKIAMLSPDIFANGPITIYGKWNPPETKTYRIKVNYDGATIFSDQVNASQGSDAIFNVKAMNDLIESTYNNNIKQGIYYTLIDTTGYNLNSEGNIILSDEMVIDGYVIFEISSGNKIQVTYDDLTEDKWAYYMPNSSITLRYINDNNSASYKTVWFGNQKNSEYFYLGGSTFTVQDSADGDTDNKVNLYSAKYWKVTIGRGNDQYGVLVKWNVGSSKVFTISGNTISVPTLGDSPTEGTYYFADGTDLTISASLDGTIANLGLKDPKVNITGYTAKQSISVTISADTQLSNIKGSASASCLTSDTLITLADGTQVRIDQLKGNESLLVWNHETGRFESQKISMLVQHNKTDILQDVVKMNFSDGSHIKYIGIHVFYDATLNTYVSLNYDNFHEYIGHEFIRFDGESMNKVVLESAEIVEEYTQSWTLMTHNTVTCFANGILQSISYSEGILNAFDIDSETLQYVNMQEDIDKYGLYTYEEFEEYITLYEFEMMNIRYFKISVGKGIITFDEILVIFEELRKSQDDVYYPED